MKEFEIFLELLDDDGQKFEARFFIKAKTSASAKKKIQTRLLKIAKISAHIVPESDIN
jgi:hypothetical protein